MKIANLNKIHFNSKKKCIFDEDRERYMYSKLDIIDPINIMNNFGEKKNQAPNHDSESNHDYVVKIWQTKSLFSTKICTEKQC